MSRGLMTAVVALILLAVATAGISEARDASYLAPPGAPAWEFPRAERPVAEIVSPTRSTEDKRDALGQDARGHQDEMRQCLLLMIILHFYDRKFFLRDTEL